MRPLTAFQRTALRTIQSQLTEPTLFLSSEAFGWQDVMVRAFHEPTELEGWVDPVVPEATLVLIARGTMLMEYKTLRGTWQGRAIRQGDLFLKPAGSVASELRWRSLSREPLQTVHVHVNNNVFSRAGDDLAQSNTLRRRFGFQDSLVTQIILALWQELEHPTYAGKLYAQTAAQLLAVHLLRYYATPPIQNEAPPQGLTQQQIQQLTNFVLTHIHQKLPLSVLAKQADFSPYHFARLFRQATGESPHQFVLRQRIYHAKHLLNETDLSLAHIAVESGFANQSHLTQIFKRFVGLTPTAYRKKY